MSDQSSQDSATTRRSTLIAMILASGTVFLQSSVVNVALPRIGESLETGLSGLQWIVDGYILTLAALLITGGSLGDRHGRRRVMTLGLVGFGLTSIACAVAPTLPWLIGARILQGIAGAMMVPGALAIIRAVYEDPEQRGEAIGQWSGWSGIVTVIGPLLGGWLVDTLSWRWVFLISVPLLAVTTWLMLTAVPESRAEDAPEHLDWIGAALISVGLGGLAYGLIEGPVRGWQAPSVILALASGMIALIAFPLHEKRTRKPMVPLRIFQSPNFTGANLATLGVYFALQGMSFFLVLFLQNVMGESALVAGLMLAPTSLLLLLLSPRFGKLANRHGPRIFMTVGPLVCGVGLLLFTRLEPDSGFWMGVLPAVLVFGLGLSATVAPLTDTVMSAVSDRHSGIASAFNNVVSRVAGLLAVAGLGIVITLTFNASLGRRTADLSLEAQDAQALERLAEEPTGSLDVTALPPEAGRAVHQAFTEGFRRVMIVNALMAFAGGGISALMIQNGSEETG
jgi:EmrB/QacA subfamily drug resistance transporter